MSKYLKWFIFLLCFVMLLGINNPLQAADRESQFRVFQEVLFLIQNYHIDEHGTDELLKGAIEGMVETLDPFSQYMNADEFQEMQVEFEGHFGGIGIVITPELEIVSPIKGTPGDKVGLKPGDMITAIDGKPTKDMTQKKAVDLMRGEPGTKVVLTVERELPAEETAGDLNNTEEKSTADTDDSEDTTESEETTMTETLEFTIIRSDIEVPYVESEMKTAEIGYISISQFVQGVGRKVESALDDLEDKGARGIILDLRSDPGGLLTEAIQVASNFIKEGTVVSIKERFDKDEYLSVDKSYQATELPMVVLVNQGSASASEIVSGAIQDYERGKLIGMKTFGKGTVQSVVPFDDGTALRLTTGRYYTPGGRFIHEKGIEPDIKIEYDPDYDGDNQLDRAIEYLKKELEKNPGKNPGQDREFKKAG